MRVILWCLLVTMPLLIAADTPPARDPGAVAIVEKVIGAAGGKVWPTVKRIKFTFNVENDGEIKLSAAHDWDLTTNIDTVEWAGKKVSVDLSKPGNGEDEKAAFQRWTNDSYWLLMPLKLLDGGTKLSAAITTRDMPASRARVTLSFENVGMTPGDQYDLSIDLKKNQIDHWVYRPSADTAKGFTWEDYKDFNGLVLSTNHKLDDGKLRIFFTNVEVTTK